MACSLWPVIICFFLFCFFTLNCFVLLLAPLCQDEGDDYCLGKWMCVSDTPTDWTDPVLFGAAERLVFEHVTQHIAAVTKTVCRPLDLNLQPARHCVFYVTGSFSHLLRVSFPLTLKHTHIPSTNPAMSPCEWCVCVAEVCISKREWTRNPAEVIPPFDLADRCVSLKCD